MGKETRKLIANNKKAWHDYFIEEKYEAGIELVGTEVKSIRQGLLSALIKTEKSRFTACMSVRTKREIFLIKIPCASESFYCTNMK